MFETGLYNFWLVLFNRLNGDIKLYDIQSDQQIVKYEDMTLRHILDVYFLYFIPIVLSLLAFIVEMIYFFIIK